MLLCKFQEMGELLLVNLYYLISTLTFKYGNYAPHFCFLFCTEYVDKSVYFLQYFLTIYKFDSSSCWGTPQPLLEGIYQMVHPEVGRRPPGQDPRTRLLTGDRWPSSIPPGAPPPCDGWLARTQWSASPGNHQCWSGRCLVKLFDIVYKGQRLCSQYYVNIISV